MALLAQWVRQRPWLAAGIAGAAGGIAGVAGTMAAAASAVVVTEVLEEGLNDISKTTYSISGDVNNLIVDVKQ